MLLHPALRPCCTACYCTLAALCPAVISLHPLHCMPAALQVTASTALHFNALLHCTAVQHTHCIAQYCTHRIVHLPHCELPALHTHCNACYCIHCTACTLHNTPTALHTCCIEYHSTRCIAHTLHRMLLHAPCIACYCTNCIAHHCTRRTVLYCTSCIAHTHTAVLPHAHTPMVTLPMCRLCSAHTQGPRLHCTRAQGSPLPCTHTHRGHLAHMQPSQNAPTVHTVGAHPTPYKGITRSVAHLHGSPCTPCTPAAAAGAPPRGLQPPEHPRAPPDPASRPSVAPRL